VPVGLFPLIAKEHAPFALQLSDDLLDAGIPNQYDDAGTIGKRYARNDEAGTPFCITVDGETMADGPLHGTVTVRLRDSKTQERVLATELAARLAPALRPPRPTRT